MLDGCYSTVVDSGPVATAIPTMPNQRDPKKKILGGFVVEEEREAAQALARLLGVTVTELIRGYIREQCRAHGVPFPNTTPDPEKKHDGTR